LVNLSPQWISQAFFGANGVLTVADLLGLAERYTRGRARKLPMEKRSKLKKFSQLK